jgi:hypothetical protein
MGGEQGELPFLNCDLKKKILCGLPPQKMHFLARHELQFMMVMDSVKQFFCKARLFKVKKVKGLATEKQTLLPL